MININLHIHMNAYSQPIWHVIHYTPQSTVLFARHVGMWNIEEYQVHVSCMCVHESGCINVLM